MGLRDASGGLMDVFTNEEVIRLGADDTLAKMGWSGSMDDGRLNGTRVWAMELHDGSMLLGLLNAESAEAADTCTWEERSGGFYQVQPATAAGNYACYDGRGGNEGELLRRRHGGVRLSRRFGGGRRLRQAKRRRRLAQPDRLRRLPR